MEYAAVKNAAVTKKMEAIYLNDPILNQVNSINKSFEKISEN